LRLFHRGMKPAVRNLLTSCKVPLAVSLRIVSHRATPSQAQCREVAEGCQSLELSVPGRPHQSLVWSETRESEDSTRSKVGRNLSQIGTPQKKCVVRSNSGFDPSRGGSYAPALDSESKVKAQLYNPGVPYEASDRADRWISDRCIRVGIVGVVKRIVHIGPEFEV